jgi:hypothetical protein
VTKKEISEAASILGKRGYRSKIQRLGFEKIQAIARENGKKGGRPKGSGRGAPNQS